MKKSIPAAIALSVAIFLSATATFTHAEVVKTSPLEDFKAMANFRMAKCRIEAILVSAGVGPGLVNGSYPPIDACIVVGKSAVKSLFHEAKAQFSKKT